MKRIFIVIDGGNLFYKLKGAGLVQLLKFDYKKFVKYLCGQDKLINYSYYVGRIREEIGNSKSKELKQRQDQLLAYLNNQGFAVKTGYILKSDKSYHEKGVDVQMAVDICMKATRNEYDKVIIVSSDTDLIPAIKEVRTLQKEVEYVGFDSNPSFAMIRFSNTTRLLKKEDLLSFSIQKI